MGEFSYLSIMTANGNLKFHDAESTSLVPFNAVSDNFTTTQTHTHTHTHTYIYIYISRYRFHVKVVI